MANTAVIGTRVKIDTSANGNTLVLGDVSDSVVGTYTLHFANDNAFSGTLIVQARARGKDAATDAVAFVPINYLSVYVNGGVGTQAYVSTTLTTNSLILVPASGFTIGIAVTCASGSCTLYIQRIEGSAA